jgi:hypothetical protein
MTFSSGWGGAYNIQYALTTPEHRVRNFTATEVAERFRVSLATINRWARIGFLRPIPNTGGRGSHYVFHELELQRVENLKKPLHM